MTVEEKGTFVDRVVNSCFDSNDNYHPEFIKSVFQITLLQMLTDIPPFSMKKEKVDEDGSPTGEKIDIVDIDKTAILCDCLNLDKAVENRDFQDLYEELRYLVQDKLEFKKQQIISGERKRLEHLRSEMETGLALISSIGEKMTDTMKEQLKRDNVVEMTAAIENRFNNLNDKELINLILGSK